MLGHYTSTIEIVRHAKVLICELELAQAQTLATGPADPFVVAAQAALDAAQLAYAGVGPDIVVPVINPGGLPPQPISEYNTLGEIFDDCCLECFQMLHLTGTVWISGYDRTATNYFAIVSEVAKNLGGGNPVPLLLYMLNNASLDDLLSPAVVHMHNPDARGRNILFNLVSVVNRSLEETWIDRVHRMAIVGGQPMPLTPAELTRQCSGSSNAMAHLSFAHYFRAFQFGLVFANVDDIPPTVPVRNTWSFVLRRADSPDLTNIVTHMASVSTTISTWIGVPVNTPGRNGYPAIFSGRATPHFLAIWHNRPWMATQIANGTHAVSDEPSDVVTRIDGPMRLAGWAAIQHFNADGLGMLSEWVDLARPRLTHTQRYQQLIDILKMIIVQYKEEYRIITDECEARLAALPVGANPAALELQRDNSLNGIEDIGRQMIRTILDNSINFNVTADITLNPNWENINMTLVDTVEFTEFIRNDVEPIRGSRDPKFAIVKPLMHEILKSAARTTRTRSRRGS
ncbi:hypothetical protein N7481_005186 [Penicillium waksmanii]|uniref:uncharacterized protein n=1 Tax=Penicillium waksmanii TaxID=69791 RepID=UPI002547D59D|nr:uncharacterized protein N7481_005186 [Penicillium waksmanii]KAJ5983087.1 hypothetical protein N7481_005186 [Penicillium waksmanii]